MYFIIKKNAATVSQAKHDIFKIKLTFYSKMYLNLAGVSNKLIMIFSHLAVLILITLK